MRRYGIVFMLESGFEWWSGKHLGRDRAKGLEALEWISLCILTMELNVTTQNIVCISVLCHTHGHFDIL